MILCQLTWKTLIIGDNIKRCVYIFNNTTHITTIFCRNAICYLAYSLNFLQIMIHWFEIFRDCMTVKMFLQYVKKWESSGFINSDVWADIDSIIDLATVNSAVRDPTAGDTKDDTLSSEDKSDDRLLSCVARYIIDSRALHFTVDILALDVHVYLQEESNVPDDKHLMKFKVCDVTIGEFWTLNQCL